MYLENIVFDAVDPQRLGPFWEAVLGTEPLTDELGGYETRLAVDGGPTLDLCFQPVPEPPSEPLRLHLDITGGARQTEVVERLLALGARHLDIGQRDVPWVVLADPEGNPFCVMEHRAAYAGTGPLAALPLDSADPHRDAEFWSWLTGWIAVPGADLRSLRHPSGLGPLLELCPEPAPKGTAKNRLHLDVRLEPGEDADAAAAGIADHGGRELHLGWGSCRGGTTPTRPATSSACCPRRREWRTSAVRLTSPPGRRSVVGTPPPPTTPQSVPSGPRKSSGRDGVVGAQEQSDHCVNWGVPRSGRSYQEHRRRPAPT